MPRLALVGIFLLFAVSTLRGQEAEASRAPGPREPGEKTLLVTVDDLPLAYGELHPRPAERRRLTRALLAILARHRVPTVGFVIWDSVEGRADRHLLGRWLAAGHELGNHTYSHLGYRQTAADPFVADAERGRSGLAAFLTSHGRKLRLFRFPFLLEGETPEKFDAMREYLAKTGQRNLPATVAFEDWKYEEPWVAARQRGDRAALAELERQYREAFVRELDESERQARELFGRPVPQVLMLHANEVGAAQWDAVFTHLVRQGYRFASADEVLADPAFNEPHRFIADEGAMLWERLAAERGGESTAPGRGAVRR